MVVEAFANIKHCVQTDMDYHKKSNHPPPQPLLGLVVLPRF